MAERKKHFHVRIPTQPDIAIYDRWEEAKAHKDRMVGARLITCRKACLERPVSAEEKAL